MSAGDHPPSGVRLAGSGGRRTGRQPAYRAPVSRHCFHPAPDRGPNATERARSDWRHRNEHARGRRGAGRDPRWRPPDQRVDALRGCVQRRIDQPVAAFQPCPLDARTGDGQSATIAGPRRRGGFVMHLNATHSRREPGRRQQQTIANRNGTRGDGSGNDQAGSGGRKLRSIARRKPPDASRDRCDAALASMKDNTAGMPSPATLEASISGGARYPAVVSKSRTAVRHGVQARGVDPVDF